MYSFWGKAAKETSDYHLLVYHCLDVAAVLHEVLSRDACLAKRVRFLAPMDDSRLNELLVFYAALHDLGKFAPAFQNLRGDIVERLGNDPRTRCVEVHHTVMGQYLFEQHLMPELSGDQCELPQEMIFDVLAPLSSAAFGHHGKPCPYADGLDVPRPTLDASREFFLAAKRLLLPSGLSLPSEDDHFFKPVSWVFAGLLVLCDWIASGDNFAYVDTPMPLADYWRDHALPASRRAVAACGILPPPVRRNGGFHDLLPHLPHDAAPTPLQALALSESERKAGQRLLIFEDVTGAGKTEAALLAAHALMAQGDAQGLYVGLPTMATANGMYARLAEGYRALFEESPDSHPSLMLAHGARGIHGEFLGSIGLEHGRRSSGDEEGAGDSGAFCSQWLSDNRKKALLAPCGAGTLDQALLAVVPSRHQCLRLLGLSRSVLIADEVHAYDPYTTRILEALLTFHAGLGGSAILLSATLPLVVKQGLAEAFGRGAGYDSTPELNAKRLPLATRLDENGVEEIELPETRQLRVDVALTSDAGFAVDRLLAVHRAGGCALFIINTVDRAVAAFEALSGLIPPEDLILFHARFTLCDRQDIEARVLSIFGKKSLPEVRRGKILVATQVVEQSLDLDADFLVSELAPMELLIQRAGRCQRHEREWRPEGFVTPSMLIVSPDVEHDAGADWGETELGNGLYVYPMHGVLWRTARMLAETGAIVLPGDARRLVEGAYALDDSGTPPVLAERDDQQWGKQRGDESVANLNILDFRQGYSSAAAFGSWLDDRVTPTRLGEESATLRLLRWENGVLRLWAGEGLSARACALSEVSVAARRIKGMEPDGDWRARLDELASAMPDKGRWSRLTPLAWDAAAEEWRCALPGWEHLVYASKTGLRVESEGK